MAELSSMELEAELSAKKTAYAKERKSTQILELAIKNGIQNGATKASIDDMRNRKFEAEGKWKNFKIPLTHYKIGKRKQSLSLKKGTVLNIYKGTISRRGDPILKFIHRIIFMFLIKALLSSVSLLQFFFVFHFFGN